MAHINLLPWREERRQERQQQFNTVLAAGFVFAAAILYAVVWYADDLLDIQNQRNTYLKSEHAKLDLQIIEIEKLDSERERLLEQIQVIQQLQLSRPKVVKVFDALVRSVPEGIHLEKVSRQGDILTFNGVAQSNARVSVFMRQLNNSDEFEEPILDVVQRTSISDEAVRRFTLTTQESRSESEDGDLL